MDWEQHFSRRARLITGSSIRQFLRYANQPGFLSFAGGLPDPALLPVEESRAALDTVLTLYSAAALQYSPTEGVPELRSWIAAQHRNIGATEENVLITTGSQQGLDLLGRILLEEGSSVAVQNPTYLAALSAWRVHSARFLPGEGNSPLGDFSEPPKMIYSIPNFSNPTGTSMTVAERTEVVRSAVRSGIPTVEDDPYGELRYEGEAIPSLLELAADLEGPIIHLRTFSKTLAPGFRVGWVVGPRKLISKLAQAKQSVDLNTSALCQYAVLELARRSDYFRAIVTAREAYRKKRDTLLSELQGQLGNAAGWTFPTGGYFVLLSLAEGRSGEELAMRALEHGVGVVPGVNFFVTGGTNTVRLSFSHIAHHSIAEGVARLAKTVRSMSHAEAPQVQNKSAR